MRTTLLLLTATLTLGCTRSAPPPTVRIAPEKPAPSAAPQAQKGLPPCAPKWLDVAPAPTPREWGIASSAGSEAAAWEGIWMKGDPKGCDLFVAVRRDGDDALVYANNCGGPGLRISNVSVSAERLILSGKWTSSSAGADVMLEPDGRDKVKGIMSSYGPVANPDSDARPEPTEAPISLTRRCQ